MIIDAASQHRHRIDGRRWGAMAMLAALPVSSIYAHPECKSPSCIQMKL